MVELENKLEDMEEETGQGTAIETTPKLGGHNDDAISCEDAGAEESFMSESIYQKLPSPKSRKHRTISTLFVFLQENRALDLTTTIRKAINGDFARAFRARNSHQRSPGPQ